MFKLTLNLSTDYYRLLEVIIKDKVNISFCKCKVHLKTEIYKISKV